MEGPRPASSTAPSTWYAEVAAPHRNPAGKRWALTDGPSRGEPNRSVECLRPGRQRGEQGERLPGPGPRKLRFRQAGGRDCEGRARCQRDGGVPDSNLTRAAGHDPDEEGRLRPRLDTGIDHEPLHAEV